MHVNCFNLINQMLSFNKIIVFKKNININISILVSLKTIISIQSVSSDNKGYNREIDIVKQHKQNMIRKF